MHGGNTWSIILAGGEGRRLRELTMTRAVISVPKQYCSLAGGPSLLSETLARAEGVCARERTLVVVSARHERFWREELRDLPSENVIGQPQARGTAAGLLLPLLAILERDLEAEVVVLPADHHVADELILRGAFATALAAVRADPRKIVLLGISPDVPDPQYGWIVPQPGGVSHDRVSPIELFVEKPCRETARRLQARGGLWSSFLFTSQGLGLFAAFSRAQPALVRAFAVRPFEAVYRDLPSLHLSPDLPQPGAGRPAVVPVPSCRWR